MKLIVAAKSAIASRLPPMEIFGHHGLTASKTPAAISKTPSSAEKVCTEKISYTQLMSGLSDTRPTMPSAS
jgi:hypothetical protein